MTHIKPEETVCIPDLHLQAAIHVDGKVLLPDSRHDPVALSPVLQAIKLVKPKRIIIMGDFFDNQHVSGWTKKVNRGGRIMTEDGEYHFSAWKDTLRLAETLLRYIRATNPRAEIIFLEGNHEFRTEAELRQSDLLKSYGSASIRNLEMWEELHIKFVPYTPVRGGTPLFKVGDITVLHGFGTSEQQYMMQNHRVVHADSHAIDQKKFGKRNPTDAGGGKDTMWSQAIGCLCHLSPEFASKGAKANAWEHGFAIISTYNGLSQVDTYRIVHGTVVNFQGVTLNYVPLDKIDPSLAIIEPKIV